MSAAYITQTFIDNHIGADVRAALFDDGFGFQVAIQTALINTASAIIKAAAQNAGYDPGDSTTNDLIMIATFGVFLQLAHGRKGLPVPEQFAAAITLADGIRNGQIPLPDTDPDTLGGVGGIKFTDSSSTTSTGKPPIFTRDNLKF